jgi:hypothetical protein
MTRFAFGQTWIINYVKTQNTQIPLRGSQNLLQRLDIFRRYTMDKKDSQVNGYILAAGLGAIGGGLVIALITKAIPKMMSKMMAGMMANMMAQMGGGECEPVDM